MLSRHEAHTQTHIVNQAKSFPSQTTPGTAATILSVPGIPSVLKKEGATAWARQPPLPYTAIFVDINCVDHMGLNSVFQLLFPVSSSSFSPPTPPPQVWEAVLLATTEVKRTLNCCPSGRCPVRSLTLPLPPPLEAPSLWCGNHSLSHPLQGTAVSAPTHTLRSLCLLYRQNFLKVGRASLA